MRKAGFLAFLLASSLGLAQGVVFLSTQLRPIEEAQKMRQVILKGFPGQVQFVPAAYPVWLNRVLAEAQTGRGTVGVLGGLHGDFPPLVSRGLLEPLDGLYARLQDRGFPQAFVELGRMGTPNQQYLPWMQATYVMVARKEALKYLPPGADLNALTYEDLKNWAKAIQEATGQRRLGFPAGPGGLIHRFLQGYLYPSYTGSQVRRFKSPEAEAMWRDFRELWRYVNPRSTAYEFMQEPLLSGEVWIAWDHTARLKDALVQRPQDFVAFPAPAGPKGRGFMPVVAGLAIPKTAPDKRAAEALVDYLTRPEVQLLTLKEVGFFPVVRVRYGEDLPEGIRLLAEAVSAQSSAKDALPSLLPVGLGDKGGEFNKVYRDAFTRIVLRGEEIRRALDLEAQNLARILRETGAPCWPPDAPSTGACPVE
mgnify:FL=1